MTAFERDLLLQFQGPQKGFQAPGGGASYAQHEEWRNTVYAGLENLEDEGLLQITRTGPNCGSHGKCRGLPIAAICRLTERGEEVLEELRAA